MKKVLFAGTHRVRLPEETLNSIIPLFGDFGITRLADVTHLDALGIPVVMAVRPLGRSLTVSQGKGATLPLAKISAAMEAIELWHSENAVPEPEIQDSCALDLGLPYDVRKLHAHPSSLITEHTVTNWIMASAAVTRQVVPVPWGMVQMGRYSREDWLFCGPNATTNGLAAGNTRSEAIVHGMYELIERVATFELSKVPVQERVCVKLDTVTDASCSELINRILAAGAWLEVASAPNQFGVPCFAAYIWAEEMSIAIAVGSGVHSDPAVALSRAITEAAQSRLTVISGSRDDLAPRIYGQPNTVLPQPTTSGIVVDWGKVVSGYDLSFATDADEEAWIASLVEKVTGVEPMVVDLCDSGPIAVVKVICGGTNLENRHDIPRPEVAR